MLRQTQSKLGSGRTFFFKRSSGNSSPFHARTQLFITSLVEDGIIISSLQKNALDRLVRDLHGEPNAGYATSNIFSKFRALYPFIGSAPAAHSKNLADTTLYGITWFGSPTHSGKGVEFSGTQYGQVFSDSGTLTAQDKCGTVYFDGVPDGYGNQYAWGSFDGSNLFGVSVENTAGSLKTNTIGMNTPYVYTLIAVGKFVSIDINGSSAKMYSNGISVYTNTGGGSGAADIIKLGGAGPIRSTMTIKFFSLGNSLTATEQANLNSAVLAYQTALLRN